MGKQAASLNVETLGQVFTPKQIVDQMINLRKNYGKILEPSAGNGAFSTQIPGCVAIEIDPAQAPDGALVMDFFEYPEGNQFETIIGNPPYVRYQDIQKTTKDLLSCSLFDRRSNLYLFFIEKCLKHLKMGGELILITPRDFVKATSSVRLNELLYETGTITHFFDLGDAKVFENAAPNCAIWRFEKGDYTRKTVTLSGEKAFVCSGGQLLFLDSNSRRVRLGDVFTVKVGAVSGADDIYSSDEFGNEEFVCSHTAKTGDTRKMIWTPESPHPALVAHKDRLISRKVSNFSERNWWQWGRSDFISDAPRIYVNGKTRNKTPFFVHDCRRYDGSVLALFPKNKQIDVKKAASLLNDTDWQNLGFVCDGRFLFSQRALEEVFLPDAFSQFRGQE